MIITGIQRLCAFGVTGVSQIRGRFSLINSAIENINEHPQTYVSVLFVVHSIYRMIMQQPRGSAIPVINALIMLSASLAFEVLCKKPPIVNDPVDLAYIPTTEDHILDERLLAAYTRRLDPRIPTYL